MQKREPRAVPGPRVATDEQRAARERADEQAERAGQIWLQLFPRGRDW